MSRARASAIAAPLLLALAAAGCGHVEAHAYALRAPGPPRPGPEGVELYVEGGHGLPPMAGAVPDRPLEAVAVLQVVGYGTAGDAEGVSRALRAQAATLGCDAVVRVHIDVGVQSATATGVCARGTASVSSPAEGASPPPASSAAPPHVLAPAAPATAEAPDAGFL